MPNRPRRKLTRRDAPHFLLMAGVLFSFLALLWTFTAKSASVLQQDLRTISGVVQYAPSITRAEKAGKKLNLYLHADGGDFHLTQEDMGGLVPGVMVPILNLRVGDSVTAQVQHDSLGRDLDWVWGLQRGGTTILSYQDT